MRIWFFDKQSGELIPSMEEDKGQNAQQSPREPGVFIESIYSTKKKPPKYDANETAVFNNEEWTIVNDFRDLKAWKKSNGERIAITEIGIEPDGEFVETAPEEIAQPVWDEVLAAWREKTEKEIYAEMYASDRDKAVEDLRHECQLALENKYFRKELPFKGYHVRGDEDSKAIIIGYMGLLANGIRQFPIPWIPCENDPITIDNMDEFRDITTKISTWVEQCIMACRVVKNNIENAPSFEATWTIFTNYRDAEI